VRSPDASWIRRERWEALSQAQRERFAPICPDFAVELLSPSDPVAEIRAKCREYIDNGAKLVWLIDPKARTVTVYRPDVEPRVHDNPDSIDATPELPGFVLDLRELLA
jgi:Uma2 family endonuclease